MPMPHRTPSCRKTIRSTMLEPTRHRIAARSRNTNSSLTQYTLVASKMVDANANTTAGRDTAELERPCAIVSFRIPRSMRKPFSLFFDDCELRVRSAIYVIGTFLNIGKVNRQVIETCLEGVSQVGRLQIFRVPPEFPYGFRGLSAPAATTPATVTTTPTPTAAAKATPTVTASPTTAAAAATAWVVLVEVIA
jgi:hypothetical protein